MRFPEATLFLASLVAWVVVSLGPAALQVWNGGSALGLLMLYVTAIAMPADAALSALGVFDNARAPLYRLPLSVALGCTMWIIALSASISECIAYKAPRPDKLLVQGGRQGKGAAKKRRGRR